MGLFVKIVCIVLKHCSAVGLILTKTSRKHVIAIITFQLSLLTVIILPPHIDFISR
jgi:hypothetical protein